MHIYFQGNGKTHMPIAMRFAFFYIYIYMYNLTLYKVQKTSQMVSSQTLDTNVHVNDIETRAAA